MGYSITVSDGITDLSIGNTCTDCQPIIALKNSAYHEDCDRIFTDDGSNDGNYIDSIGQKVYTFCPANPAKQSIRLQFTAFELAEGDTFRVYTGNHIFSNNYLEITGKSVGQMQIKQGVGAAIPQGAAGWVNAICNNLSGCLTIRWQPNGDNAKGTGWTIKTECIDQTPSMEMCTISDYTVACEIGKLKIGKIKAPKITLQNVCATDTAYYIEYDIDGKNTIRDSITIDSLCIDTLAIGTHALNIQLKFQGIDGIKGTTDDSVCIERTCVFAIQSPNLPVCNDSLLIPLGAGCQVNVRPDDLLEKPDTSGNHYQIKISRIEAGKADTLGILNNETDSVILTKIGDYSYEISDACGQACNGQLRIFDNSPPVFLATTKDTLIACAVELSETGLGLIKPKVVDNCDTINPQFVSAVYVIEGGICDTNLVSVIWEAIDKSGNSNTLNQEVLIIRPDVTKIIRLVDVQLSCGEDSPETVNDLQRTGIPVIQTGRIRAGEFIPMDTLDLSLTDYVCGYILQEETIMITGSICGDKAFRYWDLLDWCTDNAPLRIDTQNIFFVDTLAPIFTTNQNNDPIEITLDPFSCTYDINQLIKPAATDNCSEQVSIELDSIFRIKDGQNLSLDTSQWNQLTCDSFLLKWKASDACVEQTKTASLIQSLIIADKTPPTVQLNGAVQLSLTGDTTVLSAKELDGGSFDACGIIQYQIRIKDARQDWDSIVQIPCSYLNENLQLELKVTDAKGNENTGWIAVNAEDKIDPICALDDYELACDVYHRAVLGLPTDANNNGDLDFGEYEDLTDSLLAFYNLEFGFPICQDNRKTDTDCGALQIQQQYQLLEKDCGNILIKRRARAIDAGGNKSFWTIQSIEINSKAAWEIQLPTDWEGTCGETAPPPNLQLAQGACDKMAIEVTEKYFEIPGDACFKIERTYQIINWCQYQTDGTTIVLERIEDEKQFAESQTIIPTEILAEAGQMSYVQILKIHDDEGPEITIQSPDSCITGIAFDAEPFGEEDQTPLFPPYECDEIKIWRASAIDCSEAEVFTWIGKLYDADGNEIFRVDSNAIHYAVYDADAYRAEFWAFDNCGNSAFQKSELVSFRDCRKPQPYLKNGISASLRETGTIEVWANDLDQNSFDNCSDQANLISRIWHDDLGEIPSDLAGVLALPSSINFTCTHLGRQEVGVFILDEGGNWDYVLTEIEVQDNNGLCGDPTNEQSIISGKIINGKGENIEGVNLKVTGAANYSMTTQADGQYQFELPVNGNYTLEPKKTVNPLNGVSTFDLVIISQHILGIKPFNNPYQFIAADVNKSGNVSAFDLVQLRRLILGITQDFPNNKSWRFVTEDYQFETQNPADEAFPESMQLNQLDRDISYNFIGIKVGDVNDSANANQLSKIADRQQHSFFTIHLNDKQVNKGELVKIDFNAEQLPTILGYQFSLKFKELSLLDLDNQSKAYFNTERATKGFLSTSWNGPPKKEPHLFSLRFKANTSAWLSDLLQLNGDGLAPEAYTNEEALLKVDLKFIKPRPFKLYQNQPNPFSEQTMIAFDLPKAAKIKLKIMDVQGQVLKIIHRYFEAGRQQIEIDAATLGATGVLYYQLTAREFVGVEKMVVLEGEALR